MKIHIFDSSSDAYNLTQCEEKIGNGDILIVPAENVFGFLMKAWPVATSEEVGNFHSWPSGQEKGWISPGYKPSSFMFEGREISVEGTPDEDFSASAELALHLSGMENPGDTWPKIFLALGQEFDVIDWRYDVQSDIEDQIAQFEQDCILDEYEQVLYPCSVCGLSKCRH